MKKILLLILAVLLFAGIWSIKNPTKETSKIEGTSKQKQAILRVALVADSESEDELLRKALRQAEGMGINFVIGLGDFTHLGTMEEIEKAKKIFDESRLKYFAIPGDRDLWDSRDEGEEALANYKEIFGETNISFEEKGVQFVLIDNSDIYMGISSKGWEMLTKSLSEGTNSGQTNSQNFQFPISNFQSVQPRLRFVFAHKTPFHPESAHVMGEGSQEVAAQAEKFLKMMETPRTCHSEQSEESKTRSFAGAQDDKKEKQDEIKKEGNVCTAVDGFFSGDLHFFAQFKSPNNFVRIATVGAVAFERNFQGPRFAILTVFDDYSWEVEDIEIRMDANR